MLPEMQRNLASRCRFRALFAVASVALAAAAAGAAAPEEDAPTAAIQRSQIERSTGRPCTRIGCAGVSASFWSTAAGFGAAVLAAGWIARRRRTRAD
jgi:LPXTG-motif cell wall-anchored protein